MASKETSINFSNLLLHVHTIPKNLNIQDTVTQKKIPFDLI